MRAMAQDVEEFLEKCGKHIGEDSEDGFVHKTGCQCLGINGDNVPSPIEDLFFIAVKTLIRINFLDGNKLGFDEDAEHHLIKITPQNKIGNYRVDFLMEYFDPKHVLQKSLIVECDSQEFHDRDEKQRRYEKQRERFIQSLGHHIFRFTGTEIKKDPFKVAAESISYLTGYEIHIPTEEGLRK